MYYRLMARSSKPDKTVLPKRKGGRPATGRDPHLMVRAPAEMLARIDARATQRGVSRSDAVRELLELRLTVKAKLRPSAAARAARLGKAAKASGMAGRTIDKLSDAAASTEDQAQRKRRLIKGPTEFRDMRDRAIQKRDRR